jgi:hypothetical protein
MSIEAIVLKCDAGGRVLVPVARQVELVREFERSGSSGPKFAALAGIKYQTFVVWRRKHGRVPAVRRSSRRRPMELWLEAEVARAVHTADMAVLRVLARRDLPDSDYLMVPLP